MTDTEEQDVADDESAIFEYHQEAILDLCDKIDTDHPDLIMMNDHSYRDPLINNDIRPWDRNAEETDNTRSIVREVVARFRTLATEL